MDGKIEPQYQSEAIPETPVTDGVMTIVGKTFTEVTTDPKKDVMVEIYAPWCGHCQALEPEYKKLAEKFKDIDSVVIGKLDGTTNEHKDLNVDGYPTILFFPAAENAEGACLACQACMLAWLAYQCTCRKPYEQTCAWS